MVIERKEIGMKLGDRVTHRILCKRGTVERWEFDQHGNMFAAVHWDGTHELTEHPPDTLIVIL